MYDKCTVHVNYMPSQRAFGPTLRNGLASPLIVQLCASSCFLRCHRHLRYKTCIFTLLLSPCGLPFPTFTDVLALTSTHIPNPAVRIASELYHSSCLHETCMSYRLRFLQSHDRILADAASITELKPLNGIQDTCTIVFALTCQLPEGP